MAGGISRDALLDALEALADDLGETPTRKDMNDRGRYSHQPYYTEFGSWNDALDAAGFDPNHRELSDAELIDAMQDLADDLGRPPTVEEMNEQGEYHGVTYADRFGTWLDAREAAGFDGEEQRWNPRNTDEELLAELHRLADELGCAPTQAEMNELGEYSVHPYYNRFDTWRQALAEAGFNLSRSSREWPTEYEDDWLDRRAEIRERDDNECQHCGMSNAAHKREYGQTLHVHHVEADDSTTDGYVTLCKECHSKWDRLTDDPREAFDVEPLEGVGAGD